MESSPPRRGRAESELSDDDASIESLEESGSDPTVSASERLQAVLAVLGKDYDHGPCINFTSVVGRPPSKIPLASRWSIGMGPKPPGFRIERVIAPLVRETFLGNGFRAASGDDWLIRWSGPRMKENVYEGLHQYQRVNHFPCSTELTRKDKLWEHFHRTASEIGEDLFDFVPETFVLPEEALDFKKCYKKHRGLWIVKPSASSQGKGIFLLKDIKDLPNSSQSFVVSRYVSNPLLIQGLKFDLRIYVLVTSFDPLRAFIYREGLTRFASKPYSTDEESLSDSFVHLTNYSINKSAENFLENQRIQADNYGHKWSLSALNRHLRCVGVDVKLMWERIMDLIVKTLLSVEPIIAKSTREVASHPDNCFELYGFDVLVDEELKPWLLEVNLSPSMQADSPLDKQVKSSLLSDAFNLVGVRIPDAQQIMQARLKSRMAQLEKMRAMARTPTARNGEKSQKGLEDEATGVAEEPVVKRQRLQGQDGRWRAVKLKDLDVDELKLLARSLEEFDRCRNFIHLYPTPASVEQYAPITRRRCASSDFRGDLVASALFGPKPIRPSGAIRTEPRYALEHSSSNQRHDFRASSAPAPRLDADRSLQPELQEGMVQEAMEKEDEERIRNLRVPVQFNSSAADDALLVLKVLGSKMSWQLVLMEYLVRIHNLSLELRLGPHGAGEGPESSAIAFRRQLTVFLRVRGSQVPSLDDGVADQLVAVCRLAIAVLVADMWQGGTDRQKPHGLGQELALRPPAGSELSIVATAPAAFGNSSSGCRVVSALAGLRACDLEYLLRHPASPLEFRSLLEAPEPEAISRQMSGSQLRRRLYESHGVPVGPLSDLELQAGPHRRPRLVSTATAGPQPPRHLSPGPPRLARNRSAPLLNAMKIMPAPTSAKDVYGEAVANLPPYLRAFAARLPPVGASAISASSKKSLPRPVIDKAKKSQSEEKFFATLEIEL